VAFEGEARAEARLEDEQELKTRKWAREIGEGSEQGRNTLYSATDSSLYRLPGSSSVVGS
jgi:hypothetical protein